MGLLDVEGVSVTVERNLERVFHVLDFLCPETLSEIVPHEEAASDTEEGDEEKGEFVHKKTVLELK